MILLEHRALDALLNVSMRPATSGKRFRADIDCQRRHDPGLKLTKAQALLLWNLVYLYRRQIKDSELRQLAEFRVVYQELPDIYLEGDLRILSPTPHKRKKEQVVRRIPEAVENRQVTLF